MILEKTRECYANVRKELQFSLFPQVGLSVEQFVHSFEKPAAQSAWVTGWMLVKGVFVGVAAGAMWREILPNGLP